ncbi:MAG: RNA ligase partner protein [Candidatus Omnitrophota bacterium]
MEKFQKIVLDTSIFVNPDSRVFFGNTPYQALVNFLDIAKESKRIKCYTPVTIYEELMKFIEKEIPPKKMLFIEKRPPSSYESTIPALFVYEIIEQIRLRINKGLRVAEKYARKGIKYQCDNPQDQSEKDKRYLPQPGEEIIKSLREEFRIALREGIIDSKEDFDLILLAKELGAYLATSDNGLITWAHKLGVTCVSAKELNALLLQG